MPTPSAEPAVDLKAVALALHLRGRTQKEIAEAVGASQSTVSRWLAKASDDGLLGRCPPSHAFTPRLNCTCRDDPIRPGQKIVCVNCCSSGFDFHPQLHAPPLPRDKKVGQAGGLKGGTNADVG